MTQALYRRYRPDTFAEVIGQSHVTEPLQQALRADRVTHAYLFSGPRGCGKTTSARILARCLNCVEWPTDTPCGRCDSCLDLARGGGGSLDVVEIDAASHNGVDDARDLRERAAYAPARDRFKIFILDEAHMVTTQGFNALLKIVEEPPPHVKFIFATTEPDKVIGTIRSRTHHYPFRLVPPEILQTYLEEICAKEGVPIGPGVLPLVVRAGAGSVRDSLSVLDQLVAGADDTGVDYERAVALLGYTHATLLDDTVDALAARDGASVFRVVGRVIASGQEPRRFVEDLLERLRDLIVIAASGDAADATLSAVPADQLARMRTQAAHLGMGELSRAADLINAALSEMTGATSPRLHLELLCARLLLPAADDGTTGHGARLDRLERQVSDGAGIELSSGPAAAVAAAPVPPTGSRRAASPVDEGERLPPEAPADVVVPAMATPALPVPAAPTAAAPARSRPTASSRPADDVVPPAPTPETSAPPTSAPPTSAPPTPEPAGAALETELLRRRWPEVLDTVSRLRKVTRALVDQQNAKVAGLTSDTLRLSFTTAALAATFRNGSHAAIVQQAVRETLGFEVRVEGHLEEGSTDPVRPER
ncbi:MAG TPA: DNA polymerase III subunit gamma and tau, partial [Cellulomonas sp.]|nr:DNA polymerase III subunit gamma and tau [Cellulomonas sp.]